jgi:hypothetical protein
LAAVDKDVFNAESLDGFTSKARAACSDQEGRLAIKTVRQRIGELANYAIHEVPSTDNQLWRHIWDQLNEAMHDLRPWAINKKKADTKTDTEKKSSMPTGDAAGFVNFLKNKLKAREPARGEMRSLAEEYCEENQGCGSDPESLERKARKYRHLWNPDT